MTTPGLHPGDWLRIRYHRSGSRVAVYHGTDMTGRLVVRTWQASSRRFTAPIKIDAGDVLERLTESPIRGVA